LRIEVGNGALYDRCIVPEEPKRRVAVCAKKSAHPASHVVVVNSQAHGAPAPDVTRLPATDCTPPVLYREQLLVCEIVDAVLGHPAGPSAGIRRVTGSTEAVVAARVSSAGDKVLDRCRLVAAPARQHSGILSASTTRPYYSASAHEDALDSHVGDSILLREFSKSGTRRVGCRNTRDVLQGRHWQGLL
jgi:hypothetical protein